MNGPDIIADKYDMGKTNLFYLKRFWSKVKAKKLNQVPGDSFAEEWTTDTALLDALGIGIEQVFAYLYTQNNSFEEFEDWVISCNNGQLKMDKIERFHLLLEGNSIKDASAANEPEVLSADDQLF